MNPKPTKIELGFADRNFQLSLGAEKAPAHPTRSRACTLTALSKLIIPPAAAAAATAAGCSASSCSSNGFNLDIGSITACE